MIPPLLLKEKSKVRGGLTVNVNVVVRVNPPPVPATVIVYAPAGVEDDVPIINLLVNVGLPEAELNDAVAPVGRPDAERLTVWVVPEMRVTVIVFEPEPP